MTDAPGRWPLLRDVLALQAKLVADGLRDIVIGPVLLLTGLAAFVTGSRRARALYYDVVRIGRRSEYWINLFAEHDGPAEPAGPGLDDALAKVEAFVVEQHARGGITGTARQAIDRALDALQARAPRR
jgi:hypothetical protein